MKIGIDCRTILSPNLGEKAGVGHYTFYLVKNLLEIDKKNEYILFFDHRAPNIKGFEKKNTKIIKFPFSQYKKYMPFGYSHLSPLGFGVFQKAKQVLCFLQQEVSNPSVEP